MGVLERWDRRNQEVLEEHNRKYRAGEVGGSAVGGGATGLGFTTLTDWPWWADVLLWIAVIGVIYAAVALYRRRRATPATGTA